MNDPDFKVICLQQSLNMHFGDQSEHGKCLKIAAALSDVKKRLPLGTSTIEQGLRELPDKEMKFALVTFHNATKSKK